MKKKILVTGRAGFVGSHLCKRLSQDKNNEVYYLDNYFTDSKDNHVENAIYIDGMTSDIEKVYEYNKLGTFAILEFVRKHGCKIPYSGSSTKFGDGGLGRSGFLYAWTKAINTESLMIVSPDTQKRNFTNIDDIVDELILVGENGYGDEFGIGSPEAYTILEVAEMFGGEIQILHERKR